MKKVDNQENAYLLSLQEAAKILGVKAITLRKWDRENKLKSVRVGLRGDRKYYKSDLMLFLEKSQKKGDEKIEWQEYVRSGTTLHHFTQCFDGMFNGLQKNFGQGFKYGMAFFEGDTCFWYYSPKDVYDVGRLIVDRLSGDSDFLKEYFARWDDNAQKVLELIDVNATTDFARFSDKQLSEVYLNFDRLFSEWYGLVICIDATDEAMMIDFSAKVKEIVKDKVSPKELEKESAEVYNIITMPNKLSYVADERIALLELARDLRAGKIDISGVEFKARVEKIISKFWWSGLGWARGQAKTEKDVVDNLKEIEKSGIEVEKELNGLKKYSLEVKRKKNEMNDKYGYLRDKEFARWLDLSECLAEYHDRRKELQMKANYWNFNFFAEVAKRKKVPVALLDWCTPQEIANLLLKNELNETELNLRSVNFMEVHINGEVRRYCGKEAVKKHQEMIQLNSEEVRDLQGVCASGGKVVGEAFVAITINSASKIKAGQILVTSMTTPEFVPVMKKAAAIVTDEGGVTCHAAVISRELGIPCIVGTKRATKLIKTGDLLEVKASHGVVRILEKNNQ